MRTLYNGLDHDTTFPDDDMPPPTNYQEFPPGLFLAGSVECFWVSTVCTASLTASFHRVLPDGCIDVLFDFTATGGQRVSVIGTMTRPLIVCTTGPVNLLGIRFRPGGLSGFLPLDAAELTNARIDLTNFWRQVALETWHRLGEATPTDRIRLLREVLCARATGQIRTDPFIYHCVARIEAAHGAIRIGDLEKSTGLGARQLERKFAQHLGISPKTFARVVRFKGVEEEAVRLGSPDWTRLAGDFGFADQSHLVREFKAFSGLSPTEYIDAINDPP